MEPHLSGLLPRQPRSVEYSVAHADPVATTATVLKVVDGDTVDIVDDVRGRLRIRLLGIDTPETKKMWMKSTYFARLGTSLAGRGSSMR